MSTGVDIGKIGIKNSLFSDNVEKLTKLKENAGNIPWFYEWVVGIDLFADELGYPYCPFVTSPFIEYIKEIRDRRQNGTQNKYSQFGVRVHCGENVQYADDDTPAYRSFVAHMYIVFCCLRFLRYKLDYGIRIDHGIAFERILGDSMSSSMHRKSSVLRAEMRHQASQLFENIAFEVNITSNEYLLNDNLRQGNYARTHCLDELFKLKAPIILATDDDGIWPIDRCSVVHPGHHSLTAEYCRAISSSLFATPKELQRIFDNSKNFCFFDMGGMLPTIPYSFPMDRASNNAVILHPDIVKHILRRLKHTRRVKEIHKLLKERQIFTENENIKLSEEYRCRLDNIKKLDENRQAEEKLNDKFKQAESQKEIHPQEKIRSLKEQQILLLQQISGANEQKVAEGPFYTKYNPDYQNIPDDYNIEDDILWEKEYKPMAQVAYVCSCIKDDLIDNEKVDILQEYRKLFKHDAKGKQFQYINEYWKLIHDKFMKPDDENKQSKKYRHVLIFPPSSSLTSYPTSVNTTNDTRAYISPVYEKSNSFSAENFGVEFVEAQQGQSLTIYIYPGHMNTDKSKECWKDALERRGLKNIRVFIYTNNDKNKFTYIESGNSLILQVNPNATRRDKDEKQFLYALCPRACAATAALHFIAKAINPSFHNSIVQDFVSTSGNIASNDAPYEEIQVKESTSEGANVQLVQLGETEVNQKPSHGPVATGLKTTSLEA
ncbi:unnamed protein product [Didymodactylos carnosus]|uniref:Uncharacterized protein n=1 Tax=Didymodactylos carnosus TaxID=1234261 RepID=A0A813YHK4_9BILA|nr:unnamed protein product [Didymodactylos carnosus]CAF0884398.1 unnamed protein product [Didymodactylos carnosus]CAF3547256.1 unnamed protein product [Didymodactylos carnosus]CAF3670024.1 unnamed protein product [Didymodactylos carnosus]